MIGKLAIATVGLVVIAIIAVLAIAETKPGIFRVERTTSINAPPERIYALLDDFRDWSAWSPYERLDPEMKRTYSGPESGKGASYAWEGSGRVGAGRMEIAEAAPPSKVIIKLDVAKPVAAHNNYAEFRLDPKGDTTHVTWIMHGPTPYVARVMSVFFSMDAMVGKDFEAGLANLKSLAER
jgi:hypothetical protein